MSVQATSRSMHRRVAIASFERPCATSCRISRWWSLSSSTSLEERAMSPSTIAGSTTQPPRAIRRTASSSVSISLMRSLSRYPRRASRCSTMSSA
jgi:hypothetical protein